MKKAVKARKVPAKRKDVLEQKVWGLLTTWDSGQRILMAQSFIAKDDDEMLLSVAKLIPKVKSVKWVRCKLVIEKPL